VADDERPVLDELVALLRRDPRVRSVHGVSSGSEALRELSTRAVDAAFLDIHMPGLTGLDLARALSRFADRPAVVSVTADEASASRARSTASSSAWPAAPPPGARPTAQGRRPRAPHPRRGAGGRRRRRTRRSS